MDQLGSVETSLLSLIEGYVQRQALVLAALRDIRPDIVMRARGKGESTKRAKSTQAHSRISQSGFWGRDKEWEYFIHGIGCRLVHTKTTEPIEWDAGDVRRFDRNWFLNHLSWAFVYKADQDTATVLKAQKESGQSSQDFVFSRLEVLRQIGFLSEPDFQNRYTLLTIGEPIGIEQE